jgi:ribonuclease P protein component
VTTKYMTLLAQPNETAHDRLGIIASRRLGDAVLRNRAKRRLREVFRHANAADSAAERTLDIVVIPKRELVDAPFLELRSEFDHAVRRLRGRR